jgi:hypothetical protein
MSGRPHGAALAKSRHGEVPVVVKSSSRVGRPCPKHLKNGHRWPFLTMACRPTISYSYDSLQLFLQAKSMQRGRRIVTSSGYSQPDMGVRRYYLQFRQRQIPPRGKESGKISASEISEESVAPSAWNSPASSHRIVRLTRAASRDRRAESKGPLRAPMIGNLRERKPRPAESRRSPCFLTES